MADYLAAVTYDCKTSEGKDFRLTAEYHESEAFDYGNRKCLAIIEGSGYAYGLDARYDSRFNTKRGFYDNIIYVLRERYDIAEAVMVDRQ